MPQVKYIASNIKTDSVSGVGLRWEPGQVRNVTAEVAQRLLVYTDTWAEAEDTEAENAEVVSLAPAEKPVEEPLPVIDFRAMDKKTMVEFAERTYNERIDKRLSEESVRDRVTALFSKHQAEAV